MAKNYGVRDIDNWTFDSIDLPEEWKGHLGDLCEGFRMLVKGDPKNGKTEYMMKFVKVLAANHGKVNYNSVEQGKSPSFKMAVQRNLLQELPGGKFVLCDRSQKDFELWFKRLESANSGRTIVLDSADYMKLTFAQYKRLIERFPHKNIIIVCWMVNPIIKELAHTMDVIVDVKDFVAKPLSRLGGNKNFVVWEKKHQQKAQQSLF